MKGLQKGHNGAMDTAAKTIDSNLRIIRDDLLKELSIDKRLSMKKRIGNEFTKTPCQPDGGAWYYDDVLIAVFEAKKQGDIGNAIERWYKNEYVCRKINKDVSYVTFCCGEGAYENGTIGKTLDIAHDSIFNEYRAGKNSSWLSKEGFSADFIKGKVREIIMERIEKIKKNP